MAAHSSSIGSIQALIADLESGCKELTDVGQIAARHEQLRILYQAAQAELNRQIESSKNVQLLAVVPQGFLGLEEQATTLHAAWRVFQDNILTLYPHAPINYGTALVGDRIDWKPAEIAKRSKSGQEYTQLQYTQLQKIRAELCAKYPKLQKIRGDGNCFYTSFATGYLTWLCQNQTHFAEAIKKSLELVGGPGNNETCQVLVDLNEDPSRLEGYITNNQKMLPLVSYLRHRAAHHMDSHKDCFNSFMSVPFSEYLKDRVLRMGHDADNPEIVALCASLNFPLEIYDNSTSGLFRFPEDSGEPRIGVFREVAHYSLLQRAQVSLPIHTPAAHHGSSSHSTDHPIAVKPAAPVTPVLPRPAEMKRILTITYDCGYGHSIYIRGKGNADLSWDKGIKLRNDGPNKWIYETDKDFDDLEFKVLIDDQHWEDGTNHHIDRDATLEYTPSFTSP